MAKKNKRKAKYRYSVYVLVDPRDCRVRYVGLTQDLNRRIQLHIAEAKYTDHQTAKNRWMRELLAAGLKPIGAIVEAEQAKDTRKETQWIQLLRAVGAPLTNVHPDRNVERFEIPGFYDLNANLEGIEWHPVPPRPRPHANNSVYKQALSSI